MVNFKSRLSTRISQTSRLTLLSVTLLLLLLGHDCRAMASEKSNAKGRSHNRMLEMESFTATRFGSYADAGNTTEAEAADKLALGRKNHNNNNNNNNNKLHHHQGPPRKKSIKFKQLHHMLKEHTQKSLSSVGEMDYNSNNFDYNDMMQMAMASATGGKKVTPSVNDLALAMFGSIDLKTFGAPGLTVDIWGELHLTLNHMGNNQDCLALSGTLGVGLTVGFNFLGMAIGATFELNAGGEVKEEPNAAGLCLLQSPLALLMENFKSTLPSWLSTSKELENQKALVELKAELAKAENERNGDLKILHGDLARVERLIDSMENDLKDGKIADELWFVWEGFQQFYHLLHDKPTTPEDKTLGYNSGLSGSIDGNDREGNAIGSGDLKAHRELIENYMNVIILEIGRMQRLFNYAFTGHYNFKGTANELDIAFDLDMGFKPKQATQDDFKNDCLYQAIGKGLHDDKSTYNQPVKPWKLKLHGPWLGETTDSLKYFERFGGSAPEKMMMYPQLWFAMFTLPQRQCSVVGPVSSFSGNGVFCALFETVIKQVNILIDWMRTIPLANAATAAPVAKMRMCKFLKALGRAGVAPYAAVCTKTVLGLEDNYKVSSDAYFSMDFKEDFARGFLNGFPLWVYKGTGPTDIFVAPVLYFQPGKEAYKAWKLKVPEALIATLANTRKLLDQDLDDVYQSIQEQVAKIKERLDSKVVKLTRSWHIGMVLKMAGGAFRLEAGAAFTFSGGQSEATYSLALIAPAVNLPNLVLSIAGGDTDFTVTLTLMASPAPTAPKNALDLANLKKNIADDIENEDWVKLIVDSQSSFQGTGAKQTDLEWYVSLAVLIVKTMTEGGSFANFRDVLGLLPTKSALAKFTGLFDLKKILGDYTPQNFELLRKALKGGGSSFKSAGMAEIVITKKKAGIHMEVSTGTDIQLYYLMIPKPGTKDPAFEMQFSLGTKAKQWEHTFGQSAKKFAALDSASEQALRAVQVPTTVQTAPLPTN